MDDDDDDDDDYDYDNDDDDNDDDNNKKTLQLTKFIRPAGQYHDVSRERTEKIQWKICPAQKQIRYFLY